MTKVQNLSLKKPSILFLSFFGTGFAPFAPGTVGSFATLPLIYLIYFLIKDCEYPQLILLTSIALVTIYTCYLTNKIQKELSLHDPQWIVIDEVLGMLVAWSFFISNEPIYLLIVFISFRFFDIIKIWPANYFDKKVHHGAGTILDDIVSGLYAGLVSLYSYRLLFHFT